MAWGTRISCRLSLRSACHAHPAQAGRPAGIHRGAGVVRQRPNPGARHQHIGRCGHCRTRPVPASAACQAGASNDSRKNKADSSAGRRGELMLKEPNVKARTYERYEIFLKRHVVPAPLGRRPLQKITATEIDDLYKDLAKRQAPRTLAALHVVLKSCFATAVKKKLRPDNPADDAERPEVDH